MKAYDGLLSTNWTHTDRCLPEGTSDTTAGHHGQLLYLTNTTSPTCQSNNTQSEHMQQYSVTFLFFSLPVIVTTVITPLKLSYLNCTTQLWVQPDRSSPGWAPLRSGFGQAIYTCVPLSPSSIIWYPTGGGANASAAGASIEAPKAPRGVPPSQKISLTLDLKMSTSSAF